MTRTAIDLKRIHFGFTSAETESTEEPRLLLDGFYDDIGLTNEALSGHRYLFLGYKGSGKSAIGQRLKLLSGENPELFVETAFLGEFPFSQFSRILKSTGPTEQEVHFPVVWTWILLLYLVDSFSRDNGTRLDDELALAIESLRESGMLPTGEIKLLVLKSLKTGLKGMIPNMAEGTREATVEPGTDEALANVEILKGLAKTFRSDSKHILVIDGLDDILTQKSIQFTVLASLVTAVARLNLEFAQAMTPAKVVLLCRTDLFSKLPIPNKNKIRQDSAVDLDWYHDPRDPSESGLIRLANLRAKLVYADIDDMFGSVFPKKVDGKDVKIYLTEHTRHTPRDFLRLLVNIQKYAEPGPISGLTIMKGLREYSIKYFLPEIHDELVGYVSPRNAELVFDLFGSLRSRYTTLNQLKVATSRDPAYKDFDLVRTLEHLFECSALGNVDNGFYWFKYRNRDSNLNLGGELVFHPGIWKALNIADNPADGARPSLGRRIAQRALGRGGPGQRLS